MERYSGHSLHPISLPDLSDDIVTEILLLLPAKSLLRFKLVRKSWLSLISSPRFINSHLTKVSKAATDHTNVSFSVFTTHPDLRMSSFSLHSLLHGLRDNFVSHDFPFVKNLNEDRIDIVGSCNGLICIAYYTGDAFGGRYYRGDIVLWNPSTRKLKVLPNLGMEWNSLLYKDKGFCYDEYNNDYKVVILQSDATTRQTKMNVYSSRTGLWKEISDGPRGRSGRFSHIGVLVNGKLHWVFLSESHSVREIVSIDLRNETHHEFPLPNCIDCILLFVAVLNGHLSVALLPKNEQFFNIWVMDECGIKESWTKLCKVPLLLDGLWWVPSSPLYTTKTNELVLLVCVGNQGLHNQLRCILHSLKTGETWEEQRIDGLHPSSYGLYTFNGSLVSPDMVC